MSAPICPHCGAASVLTDGREIYPHRPDLAVVAIWVCRPCDARVGCHPGTTTPLGSPANAELRAARMKLHNQMLDPIWKTADRCGEYTPEDERARRRIRQIARSRVYAFLADRLGIPAEEAHTGMFDLDRCRAAWRALQGVTYREVRAWARARKEPV